MQDDRYSPSKSFLRHFDDPDAFAAAIPGGNFGVLPVGKHSFRAMAHATNLTQGVAVRGFSTSDALAFRSEFIGGPAPSITYLFPATPGAVSLFDGKEMSGSTLVSREPGQTPQLRTFSPYELGAVVVLHEALRRAAAAYTGREHARLLLTPASLTDARPQSFDHLKRVYAAAAKLLTEHNPTDLGDIGLPGIVLLRDEVMAALLDTAISSDVKRDHRARQRQTASMARIERFIDDHRDHPEGLQALCEETGMALRTVEAIVRSRTGVSALTYLHRRHLAFAREALLNPDDGATVTRIAMQNGFLHLGRFSVFYREIYGESPSMTLDRVLGRSTTKKQS
ncbi:AraC family transcriptional regulator [Mesorhizobium sp. VK25A]|uniref:AraC family transcriptional regulator n=1 Tax=Mesorhizobium vachelliae TaxID=3072309 RepID=A0ABU4ZWZ5_9HYPH|nr:MULTISPECIES: AraC family transcriptional regulator [unclassified Mesorhizobium]MDX8529537.1 AraC family transcriptional regulator [Mesorhizobium sp. VK25D]MDX8545747.1 AraC family transcriptional regulator [Mesorhizobium sp. VK25A]